jgi:tRNA-modifying protein YgfZ
VDPDPTHPAARNGGLEALREGRAFVDLTSWWKTSVAGTDAVGWLHDLLTADVASLHPRGSRRSLLLSPTGRIRADVHLVRRDLDLLLLQSPDQPQPIRDLLAPYVLSSDVRLDDVTGALALFAVPGSTAEHRAPASHAPSVLGAGHDEVVEAGPRAQAMRQALAETGLLEVHAAAVETDRIHRGVARMGPDFDDSSLPAEAGLETLIDVTKGCFLGQESVARIRDRGHPPRVLRRLRSERDLRAGDAVWADGREVGRITSAASHLDAGTWAIARVRWDASGLELTDSDGHPLVDVPQAI